LAVSLSHFEGLGWKNAMGAMARRRDKCHGSHGKKVTRAKRSLGKCHGAHGNKAMSSLKRILSGSHGAS